MNDRRAEEFLDLYRRLETAAEKITGGGNRNSSVMALAHHREFRKYRDELDYARQVRNLLSHEAKINGAYGVVPGETLFRFMEKMVNRLENPPTVQQVMTPVKDLLLATPNHSVLSLMKEMEQRGLSHLPLLEQGKVVGMFSLETVFQWVLHQKEPFDEHTTIQHLAPYLPLEPRLGTCYVTVPSTMRVNDAKEVFDKAYERNQKIKLLLVTQKGTAQDKLLGVVSPYDLLEKD